MNIIDTRTPVAREEPDCAVTRPPYDLEKQPLHLGAATLSKVAFTCDGRDLTFAELDRRASKIAAGLLAAGLRAGDRLLALLPSSTETYELLLGCARVGVVFVPLNWRLAEAEMLAVARDAEPAALVVHHTFAPIARRLEDGTRRLLLSLRVDDHRGSADFAGWVAAQPMLESARTLRDNQVVLQIYTSGTSGTPKGVLLTHGNLATKIPRAAEGWGFTEGTVSLLATPLFHVGGLGWGLAGLYSGARTIIVGSVPASVLVGILHTERVTHSFLVPTLIQRLCDEAGDARFPDLQAIVYGAAPITAQIQQAALKTFDCSLFHVYGLTETTGAITQVETRALTSDHERRRRLLSAGRPYPWIELSVRDPESGAPVRRGAVGEIWTRSGQNTPGYFRAGGLGLLTPDGWLRTGDAGCLDEDGYLFLTDRVKDMIITGGENVYPVEVETVLRLHDDVADVAVVGLLDARWGERVTAAVVLKPGRSLSEADVIAFTKHRLAGYKRPRSVFFVDELPRTATGKVQKRRLVESLARITREQPSHEHA
jgi:long-chain acyl-CoA synthetase